MKTAEVDQRVRAEEEVWDQRSDYVQLSYRDERESLNIIYTIKYIPYCAVLYECIFETGHLFKHFLSSLVCLKLSCKFENYASYPETA